MIGTTLSGRFRLEKELGRGGMGAVFRAHDTWLERSVAIKVLKDLTGDEVGRKIRLEAQILARLVHQNVVRLYDFSTDGETYFFIMEEVDGPSFARRAKKIPLDDRLRIIAQTAEALDYAHRQGVIHRDVKPANILLTSSDTAKLSDFGLSTLTDSVQESGIVRGTPHYMSPEQAKGKRVDHRTDLYALGVILYECTTGALPFVGSSMSVMSQHVSGEVTPPREKNHEISDALQTLILNLLAKAPGDRPGSGEEVAARLRRLLKTDAALVTGGRPEMVAVRAPSVSTSSGAGTSSATGPGAFSEASINLRSLAPEPAAAPAKAALARALVDVVTAEPIVLTPDERYLFGHYLGYLLGGSRRRGILLRRPLDPKNADRARLMLAMTAATLPDGDAVHVERAAALLDDRHDVRPLLTPTVVAKYLVARSTPARRKRFRQVRQQLQAASEYASRHLVDERGVINPGLMPQILDDLRRLAPERTEVDDLLVERWNQVSEVWHAKLDFRQAVLRYATVSAWRDPASASLWPEVVYPLIERARRHRQLRSGAEALWDAVAGGLLHVGDAGPRMDRAIRTSVPQRIVHDLDDSAERIIDEPMIEIEPAPEPEPDGRDAPEMHPGISAASFHDLEVEPPTRDFVRLTHPEPEQRTLGELKALWLEAMAALRSPGMSTQARYLPLGPYRLTAIPSVRSRSAVQLAVQGMRNKQIELLVPPFSAGAPATKILVAAWTYSNGSLVITYYDNLRNQKFILWDAPIAQQTNFDDASALNHQLYGMGLEAPEGIDRALTRPSHRESNAASS